MAKPLAIHNLVFYPLETNNNFVRKATQKYMAGTSTGLIFSDEIYTLEEILSANPNIKEVRIDYKEES